MGAMGCGNRGHTRSLVVVFVVLVVSVPVLCCVFMSS